MIYAIDAEFIDTPTCSALISFAIVRADGKHLYFEFDYPVSEMTEWLNANVVPKLTGQPKHSFADAALEILQFIDPYEPVEIWGYYAAYDWYWLCRLFGGFMGLPRHWPHRPRELADHVASLNVHPSFEHNCLYDALATLHLASKLRNARAV